MRNPQKYQQTYDPFQFRDYKQAIKERLNRLKSERKSFTLKQVAQKIPIQYTYLSMVLNKADHHLTESHLFRIGEVLGLLVDEIDFLMLLRSHAIADGPKLKSHFFKRIEQAASQKSLRANHEIYREREADIDYLLNPVTVLIRMALDIPEFQKNPFKLCQALGVTSNQLKESLEILIRRDLVVMDDDSGKVRPKNSDPIHFGKNHPLMRTHQVVIKNALLHRLGQTPEADKESFFATFTMDEAGFLKVKNLTKEFMGKVQATALSSKDNHLFQLSFDLVKWF